MNQKGKIKSFAVWTTAMIGAIVMASIAAGPIALFIISATIFRLIHGQPPVASHAAGSHQVRDAFALLAFAPLIYGIAGFILTAFASWLYNVLSPRFGGIEVELIVEPDPLSGVSPSN
jgi:hypothetical protein